MYKSKKIAFFFAIFGCLVFGFLIFGPLRNQPWYIRWLFIPLFAFYLWSTPPRRK